MDDHAVHFDQQVFSHTAALFSRKRSALPPDIVEGFAKEVIERMVLAAKSRVRRDEPQISPESVRDFCDVLLQPGQPGAALEFIMARRAEGVTTHGVYLGYIGEAARLLGTRWEMDELTPLDVTIGAGNLYALMRALRTQTSTELHDFDVHRSALFATVPGEHHGIGITVAANIFREARWDIDLQLGLDESGIVERVERTKPTIVGLSLSTRERLPELLRLVVALRIMAPDTRIGVAPGGDLSASDLRSIADIDMVFQDASSALADLERIVRNRP